MSEPLNVNFERIANELHLPVDQVKATFELLEAQQTVSFIARYRKDQTNGLSEEDVARIETAFKQQVRLAGQKYSFTDTIQKQGKLTPELKQKIQDAHTGARLEDLYLPFRSKRGTAAQDARNRGFEPLADAILNASDASQTLEEFAGPFAVSCGATVDEALLGAGAIIAERYSETYELRRQLRDLVRRTGTIVTKKLEKEASEVAEEAAVETADNADDKKNKLKKSRQEAFEAQFSEFFDASFPLSRCSDSRILAIARAEKAEIVSVEVEVDMDEARAIVARVLAVADRPYADFLAKQAESALVDIALPALKADERAWQHDRAQERGANDYAKNLRNLLMRKPLKNRRVIALEPGYNNGGSLVALDETGAVLDSATIFFQGAAENVEAAEAKLAEFVDAYNAQVVVIGKSGKSRDAERFVVKSLSGKLAGKGVVYIVLNSVGVAAYAESLLGKEELPSYEAPFRCAISLGRRMQDPLFETIKASSDSLCVFGARPSEVYPKKYRDAVKAELSLCVNRVGVDLNAAPQYVLSNVSGLTSLAAQTLVDYRVANGPFKNREQLRNLKGVGELAFQLSAGFLKIYGGDVALDETFIHPESYGVANAILEKCGAVANDLRDAAKLSEIQAKLAALDNAALAAELNAGQATVADIVEQLANFGKDPRENNPAPIFKSGAFRFDDVKPGAELIGTVERIADFGAFVDVGLPCLGLVHISRLSAAHVVSTAQCVSIGDVLKVWVLEIDAKKRRISLTALPPGAEREPRGERRRAPGEDRAKSENGEEKRERRAPRRDRDDSAREPRGERRRAPREDRAPRSQSVGPKTKEFKPITEGMKSGKEPMRSFGDLLQFFGGSDEQKK